MDAAEVLIPSAEEARRSTDAAALSAAASSKQGLSWLREAARNIEYASKVGKAATRVSLPYATAFLRPRRFADSAQTISHDEARMDYELVVSGIIKKLAGLGYKVTIDPDGYGGRVLTIEW